MRRTAGRGREAPWARNAGGGATRARAHAVREAIEAAEVLARGVVGPAGGFAPGHAAAAGMAQQGPFTTFNSMLAAYVVYTNLPDEEREAFFRARASFKHTQTEMLKDGPGDLTVLGQALQAVLRVATAITVTRYFGPNEELGIALLLSVFDGDALSLARTSLADTPPSPPCPVASLTRGIVVRVPSKSFSAVRKNCHLQNLSHRSCALSGCCPPTPPHSCIVPAGSVRRPARPLTLHRLHTVDSNGRLRPALAPAQCTSAIDLVGTADIVSTARNPLVPTFPCSCSFEVAFLVDQHPPHHKISGP